MSLVRNKLSSIFSLTLTLHWSSSLGAPSDTRNCVEQVLGEEVVYVNVKNSNLRTKLGRIRISEFLGTPNEITIGIDEVGHSSLSVGGFRYDGDILPFPGAVKKTDLTDIGLLIRIQGVPPEKTVLIVEALRGLEGKKVLSANCISGVCNMLEEHGGIKLATPRPWMPANLYRSILKSGFASVQDGTAYSVEIFQTGSKTVGEIGETIQAVTFLVPIAGGVIAIGLTTGGLLVVAQILQLTRHSGGEKSKNK